MDGVRSVRYWCGHGLACARACRSRVRTRMLVSRAHAHYLHAYFVSCRSTKMTSRRLPTYIVPGPFWLFEAHLRTLSPVWALADVTNQARLRMLSACVCMLWPSPAVLLLIRLPVHRSLCVSFSLSDALLVQHGTLHSGCAPPNRALCLLGCDPLFSVWVLVLLTERPESFEMDLPSSTFGCLPASIFQSGPFK